MSFCRGRVAVVVAAFVNLGVYRCWALLVVSGPTHRIRVVVVHSLLLGGIRQWSSLGRICRCWAGFAGVGLHWGGSLSLGWIFPCWSFVVRWDSLALVAVGVDSPVLVVVGLDLPGLVLPTLVLPALTLRCWLGFVAVGRRWGDSSPLGWNRWRWSSLGWVHPLWSSSHPGFQLLRRFAPPSFTALFPPPYPCRFCSCHCRPFSPLLIVDGSRKRTTTSVMAHVS